MSERWDAWAPKKGLSRPGPVSLNHYAFGAVGEWMYDAIGGIALDPTKPGGRHVIPVGSQSGVQTLMVAEKKADGTISKRNILGVRFVPLTRSK